MCGGIACRSLLSRGQGQSLQLKDGFLYCLLKYRYIYFREATKIYHYFRGLYEEAREGEETIRGIEAWGTKNRKFAKKVAWSASRGKHRARGTKTGTV